MSGGESGGGASSGGASSGGQSNAYHSSQSINTPSSSSSAGGYAATRNGQKPAYQPKNNNQAMKNKNNTMMNNKQANMGKQQNQEEEPEMAKLGAEQQIKKAAAKKALTEAAKAYNPAVGVAVEKALETKKGDEYLDTFAKEESTSAGVKAVVKKANDETKKKRRILALLGAFGPFLFFLMIVGAVLGKNAGTQVASHDLDYWEENESEEEGFVDDESGLKISEDDDTDSNIYKNYPGLYQKVSEAVRDVSKEKEIVVDKHLILATLIAPIENGMIQPVERSKCEGSRNQPEGDTKLCYPARDTDGKLDFYNYEDFISVWSSQAELLANMQIMTYSDIYNGSGVAKKQLGNINCSPEDSMEQVAKNDKKVEKFKFGNIFAFWTWGHDFADRVEAEVNIRCIKAPVGQWTVPDVRVLSIDQGTYYTKPDGVSYEKNEKSGGVYFWNLLNKNGFIDSYFRDYLSYEDQNNDDENYENNLPKILEIANYIYSYYESIRLDCEDHKVMEARIDKIDFKEDGSSPTYTLDFEDAFVGGSVLATYGGATGEVAKAQAVITRSEAYSAIVEEGMSVIVGSAKMGCWWWKYNPTYDPSYENQEDNPKYDPDYPKKHFPEIYKAVQETRGLVVTNYGSYHVLPTEYDAFCPTTREPIGEFYYLPDGQRNLPISTSYFSVPTSRVECPCFQNEKSRPKDQFVIEKSEIYPKKLGRPSQTTTETCWDPNGETKTDIYGNVLTGYKYHATGGHGRGVSQHGMAYFSQWGYKWDGLLGLFLDHNGSVKSTKNITYRRLDNTIEKGLCSNAKVYAKQETN